jgi:hypothetical protein
MRGIIAALTLGAVGLLALLDPAAADSKSGFSMDRCMANVQARGLTARRAAGVCRRNSQGTMYRSVPGTTTPKDWGR